MDTSHYLARIFALRELEHPHKMNAPGDTGWEPVAVEGLGGLNDTRLEWLLVFKQHQTH